MCEKEYASIAALNKHVKIIHKKHKPYKSNLCDFKCAFNSGLKQHISAAHEKRKTIQK
jgi:hypothetical protein